MSADLLLARLDRVRRTGHGRWTANCPAHDSKSKSSLSIRELDDGRVLVHCFAGCEVHRVVEAVGLDIGDLFPKQPAARGGGERPERRPFLPADVFEVARLEVGVVCVIASDMTLKRHVSQADFERLAEAVSRLERISHAAYRR